MKTLKLEDLALVSGGNDEPTSLFVRNDGQIITDVEDVAADVQEEISHVVTDVQDEITHVVGFSLTKLNFGCC